MRWRAALIGAIIGTLLFLLAYYEEAGLLTEPRIRLGPFLFSAIIPAVLVALALQSFLLGRDLEIHGGWSRRGLGRVLLLGLFAGTLIMAWSGTQPHPEWFERMGVPDIIEGMLLSLPMLLPLTVSRRSGAALLGNCAALPPLIVSNAPPHFSTLLLGILLTPLLVEILHSLRKDQGLRTLMLAGAAAGIGQSAAAYVTNPGSLLTTSWPADFFIGASTGIAAAWLIHRLKSEIEARRGASAKGGRP